MPIDPRIALASQPAKINTPFENLDLVMQAQQRQQQVRLNDAKMREAERSAREQQAVQQILQQTQGDWETALPQIRRVAPLASLEIEKALGEERKKRSDAISQELDNEHKLTGKWLGRLRGLPEGDDELYQMYREAITREMPDLGAQLPGTYDKAALEHIQTNGLLAQEHAQLQKSALEFAAKGEWRQSTGAALATATSPEEWQEILTGQKELGAPAAVLRQFGPWSPDAPQRARQMGMTGAQQASDATQRQGQAITLRGQDLSAETARRGQDMTAGTAAAGRAVTMRGQDLTAKSAADRLTQDKASGAGGAKLSAAAIEKVAGADTALGSLAKIAELLPSHTSTLGPVAGRAAQARQVFPGASEGYAEFAAEVATLKNAVVKATTGAAMSEPEAKRIMSQVPDLTNQPEVFRARLTSTARNLEMLKRRTIELSGGTVPEPAAAPKEQSGRIGPYTYKVKP